MIIRGKLFHCCLFNRKCWKEHFEYGMPLRLHIGERYWTIPFSTRRGEKIWDEAKAVKLEPVRLLTREEIIEWTDKDIEELENAGAPDWMIKRAREMKNGI